MSFAETAAPLIAAPVPSITAPVMLPVVSWADALCRATPNMNRNKQTATPVRTQVCLRCPRLSQAGRALEWEDNLERNRERNVILFSRPPLLWRSLHADLLKLSCIIMPSDCYELLAHKTI